MAIQIRHSRQGSILIAALILVAVAASTAAAVIGFTNSMHKLSQRSMAMEKAAVTAEAGVDLLYHYIVRPSDAPDDLTAQKAALLDFAATKNAVALIGGGGLTFVDASSGLKSDLVNFTEEGASEASCKVVELQILPPEANVVDGFAPSPAGTAIRLRSVAEVTTSTGDTIQRTALMDLSFTEGNQLQVPAGLIVGGNAANSGHFNMHWGGAWAIGDIKIASKMATDESKGNKGHPATKWWISGKDNTGNTSGGSWGPDPWVNYKSALGFIHDGGGPIFTDYDLGAKNVANSNSALGNYGDYENVLFQKVDDYRIANGEKTLSDEINEVLDQFRTIGDSSKGYDYWKQIAINRGTYHQVDGNVQNIFKDYRQESDPYVIFFDTVEGLPPGQGGTPVNINLQGKPDSRSKGLIYVCGSMKISGQGSPPIVDVRKPDDVQQDLSGSTPLDVFHDGIVFTWNDFNNTGNNTVYGSIVVNGNYGGTGNPEIYYNEALKNGAPQNLNTEPFIEQRQL